MWKLTLLAFAVMLIPSLAHADGDPGLYANFGEDSRDVIAGETVTYTIAPTNFGFTSGNPCPDTDTFCVYLLESAGWFDNASPPLEECQILNPGYLWWQDITFYVPCNVNIGDYDTIIVRQTKCDDTLGCPMDIPDCNPLTEFSGVPRYDADTVIFHVVWAPPSLYILQDSIYFVSTGQPHAFVPFSICNGDPCAPPTDFSYSITSMGHIPGHTEFPQQGSIIVAGGECDKVYAIVNADTLSVGGLDTLTIVAWNTSTGAVSDTCVQIVAVVET